MDRTISEVIKAIRDTLATAAGIEWTQGQDEITEGVPVTPLVQCYWAGFEKSPDSGSDRITYAIDVDTKPIRETVHRVNVDVLARQRSHIDLDLDAVADTAEAIDSVLEDQNAEPLFGSSYLKAFDYTVEFVNFESGGVIYAGERFNLEIWLF
jgi:hypothetical protein